MANDMSGNVLDVDFKKKKRVKRRSRGRGGSGGAIAKRRVIPGDFMLTAAVMALVLFGMIMVFSSSYYNASLDQSVDNNPYFYLIKHAVFVVLGFAAMFFMSKIDYSILKNNLCLQIVIVAAFAALFYVLANGTEVNNARRWIDIAGFTVMPGELAKPALILFTSAYLARDPSRVYSLKGLAAVVGISVAAAGLIAAQPNLSTAITNLLIVFGLLFIAGTKMSYLLAALGAAAAGGIAFIMSKPANYWMERINSFFDPFADSSGNGYQVVQGLLALGSGGIGGKLLGQSVQKKLYLPEQMNDFILAVIGEELGFIGILLLMAAYVFIIWRCVLITVNSPDRFGMLLAGGITLMLGLQVIMNMLVVLSLMPATGVSLPFISYGGNSLLIFMTCMGIMISISKRSHPEN